MRGGMKKKRICDEFWPCLLCGKEVFNKGYNRSKFCCKNHADIWVTKEAQRKYYLDPRRCIVCNTRIDYGKRINKTCSEKCRVEFMKDKRGEQKPESRLKISTTLKAFYKTEEGKAIREYTNSFSRGRKHTPEEIDKIKNFLGNYWTQERRDAASRRTRGKPSGVSAKGLESISKKASARGGGGRCKWFKVAGQSVQGTWERNLALLFELLEIKWEKPKTNRYTFSYEMDGKTRSYTPDFFLPELDLFVETKGFWWGNDKEKMKAVFKSNPEIRLALVEKDSYLKLGSFFLELLK